MRSVVSIAGRPGMIDRTWVSIAPVMRRWLGLVMYDFEVRSSVMRLSMVMSVMWSSIVMAIVWLSVVMAMMTMVTIVSVVAMVWLMMIVRLSHMMMTCCALWLLLGHWDMQLVNSPAGSYC